jgi:hypothetical protein
MSDAETLVWLVSHPDTFNVAIVSGKTREDAKRRAHTHIGYPSDAYTVSPLTEPNQGVFIDLQFTPRSFS